MIFEVKDEERLEQAVEIWRAAEAGRGQRPSTARIAEVHARLAQSTCVLLLDRGPVAMAAGDLTGDTVELTMAYVLPTHQRQGYGGAVVDGLADLAWGLGARTMTVWTAAPAFFEAIGFEATGRARDQVRQLTAELEPPTREIRVASGIRLGQLLKLAELVETGSEGKALLAEGGVEVNGEVEHRRGRQMADGDEVRAREQSVRVVLVS